MRVEMAVDVSGTRDGKPWPRRGEVVEVPEDEAESLVASGMAKPAYATPAPVEAAVSESPKEEHATVETKPARKPVRPRRS